MPLEIILKQHCQRRTPIASEIPLPSTSKDKIELRRSNIINITIATTTRLPPRGRTSAPFREEATRKRPNGLRTKLLESLRNGVSDDLLRMTLFLAEIFLVFFLSIVFRVLLYFPTNVFSATLTRVSHWSTEIQGPVNEPKRYRKRANPEILF